MIDFLYSNKMQFIIHLILSIYILLSYGMDIFEKFYRKKYNNDKYETNVKSNKIIGYYYLIVETFFLIINIQNINYVYIIIHIISSIVIIISIMPINEKL